MQELETRLLHMESVFNQLAPVLDQLNPSAKGDSSAGQSTQLPKTNPTTPSSAPTHQRSLSTGSSPIKVEQDEVSETFGQLALDDRGHKRWIGGSSTMSLIQSFRALTASAPLQRVSPMEDDPRLPGPSANKLYFPASVFFGKVRALPGPEEVEYPDRDLADSLVEAYFRRFHYLMPVIDKPSFIKQYTHVMDNQHDVSIARNETAFVALVFAVFACAAQILDDPRLKTSDSKDDGGMGMVYYERALILHHISHAGIQVEHVQCHVLLASYLCSVNCLPQAWLLTGQAVRTGQDLGLHRSPRRYPITNVDKETLRKIWWCVYILDRMLALALGRPLGINDIDCDVEFPVEVDDVNLSEYFNGANMPRGRPSLMTGFVSLIKLYEIAGRVLRQVYALDVCKDNLEPEKKVELQRAVESLDNDLTKWCDDLLPVFKSESETDEQVSMGAVLASHYYSVLTTLHRNFLPVRRGQAVPPKSTAKAVSSARSCIRLAPSMKHVVPLSHHLAFFIQNIFSSAVILLLYAMHANDPKGSLAAMEEAKSSLSALESWDGQWPGAMKTRELLAELTSIANEAIVRGLASATDSMPASPIGDRRRSVTISAPSSTSPVRRNSSKPRTRRNQSREGNRATPYSIEGRRARSASRRRPEVSDVPEEQVPQAGSSLSPFYQSISSPSSLKNGSGGSSPAASTGIPSPTLSPNEHLEGRSAVQPTPFSYTSLVPSQLSDASDFGLGLGHHSNPSWGSNDAQELFSPTATDSSMFSTFNGLYPSAMDASFNGGGNGLDHFGMNGFLNALTPLETPGLPFQGLEMLRNYNTGSHGYPNGMDQDSLWQSYDPGAFGYAPEVTFTLGGYSEDGGRQEDAQ